MACFVFSFFNRPTRAFMLHFAHMKLRWNWNRWPLAVLALLFAGGNVLAHEKWFVDERALASGLPIFLRVDAVFAIAAALAVAALFLLAVWIDRRLDGSRLSRWFDDHLSHARLNPRAVLGALIGVSLMGAGLQGTLFAPNLVMPANEWGWLITLSEIALGTLFLFLEPLYAEFGVLLAALFLTGFAVLPFWDLMEEVLMLGAAVFFMTTETSRLPWRGWNAGERRRLGYHAFRVCIGLNFLILAAVKWLRPELALDVVATYRINFLHALHVSDVRFVYLAALVESAVALCILLRVAFRPALLLAFLFFTVSIYFLGFTELLGHLPIKAALFLLFVCGHWHKGEQKLS